MSDEFLFMPEYHQTQPMTQKKGTDFCHCISSASWLNNSQTLEQNTGQGKRSSGCTEAFTGRSKAGRNAGRPHLQSEVLTAAAPGCRWWSSLPFPREHRAIVLLMQDSKSTQPLQSLAQPTALKISECNFTHGLKFCFLIWFVNDARQELSPRAHKAAQESRLIWGTG